MDAVGLMLGLAGTLEQCLRHGRALVHFCRDLRNLSNTIDEMSFIIENIWQKMEEQVKLLRKIWDDPSLLPPLLQSHYAVTISHLDKKLLVALDSLEKCRTRRILHTSQFARVKTLYLTKDLKKIVADLETWQQRFDPSWYMITLLSTSKIDEQLQSETDPSTKRLVQIRKSIRSISNRRYDDDELIFKPSTSITGTRKLLPGTNTYILSDYNGAQVLLDRTNYGRNADPQTVKDNVSDLARQFSHVDPGSFGLLKCIGAVEIRLQDSASTIQASQKTQFEFIFQVPDGLHSPKTLRDILLSQERVSLTKRMKLAKQLARSVMFVHTTGFVHKGIRPETIVVFEDKKSEIGPSFLIGFERIRHAQGQTDLIGDLEWQKNLYRHPHRQGLWPEKAFKMQHDIYSLGVCLLEVALWKSFVLCGPVENTSEQYPWSDLKIEDAIRGRNSGRGGRAMKEQLITITKERLASLVGDQYTNLVLACLHCLDPDSENNVFEGSVSGARDDDEIGIGVRYIENILLKLEDLFV